MEERTAQRATPQSEDCDEEEWEAMQEKGKVDNEMQETIAMCIAAFFKPYGASFLEVFTGTGMAEMYITWLSSDDTTLRKVAMWVWADAVEHATEASLPFVEHFLPAMLAYTANEQPTRWVKNRTSN